MSHVNYYDLPRRPLDEVFADLWALLPKDRQEMPLDDFARFADFLIDRARRSGSLEDLWEMFQQVPGFAQAVEYVRPTAEQITQRQATPIPTAADLEKILAGGA